MLKFLILLAFLVGSSFALTEAFSLEIEFQKETERIKDAMGWINPESISFQEQIQLVIDSSGSKNRISIGMMSKDPNDIRFPDYIENIVSEPKIISFIITNQFACAPNQIDKACVIIDLEREGLGDSFEEITKNSLEIANNIVGRGVLLYAAEHYSTNLEKKTVVGEEKTIISRVTYTINKQTTENMFKAIAGVTLSSDIITSGGFYEHAKELSRNNFAAFSISLIPLEDDIMLRTVQVSLICSDKLPEYIRCPENVIEQIERGDISPLDFLQVENVSKSKMFGDEFVPLNSIIQVLIFSEQDLQVKNVNSNLIEKLYNIGDIQENGWFFESSDGKIIDGRYVFGEDLLVNKNDLVFSIGSYSGDDVTITSGEGSGGCLIATATFGSELAPQVQLLREIRDNTVLQTESGTNFMTGFNHFYYSFSPTIADYERENPMFKETVKLTLTPLLTSLTLLNYVDIDSESEMLGYGIGVILLNIGMYFVAPAILIMKIKKQI